MNKIVKEPLLHFLILGGLIYVASMLWSNSDNQIQEIIVSEGRIKHLTTLYKKTWQREPTQEELEKVVNEYVLEQAAYYEGVNLGLDKDDVVITRRVRQKLDFIAEESTSRPEVNDQILSLYLKEHAEQFQSESLFTFHQIYLDPKKHGKELNQQIEILMTELQQKPDQDTSLLGDRILFKPVYQQQSISEIKRTLGNNFSQQLTQLNIGKWIGPVHSSFGVHLIYIEENIKGRLPELSEVRPQVLREWENSLQQASLREYYDELLKRYPATIHWPEKNK